MKDTSVRRDPGLPTFLIFCAIAMSLGWGLRGTIGGGPMGATIPGVMITLAICLLVRRPSGVAVAAALGTIGIGLGGQMTYGQTIGFVRFPETELWGLLGLTVKGAVWGLSGGVLLGLGLVHEKFTRRQIFLALLLMVGGTFTGWAIINHPKLIYFSNRLDKPREEIWAGLLFGAIAATGYLAALKRSTVPTSFALWGLLFGGLGFGGGGVFNKIGLMKDHPISDMAWWNGITNYVGWWKMMELSFGLLLGLGYGLAAWRNRKEISESAASVPAYVSPPTAFSNPESVAAIVLSFGALWLQFHWRTPATFSLLGAILILLAINSSRLACQVAISFTVVAFVRDLFTSLFLHETRKIVEENAVSDSDIWLWTAIATIAIALQVDLQARRGKLTAAWGFLFVTWSAVIICFLKFFIPICKDGLQLSELREPHFVGLQSIFILSAAVLTPITIRLKPRSVETGA